MKQVTGRSVRWRRFAALQVVVALLAGCAGMPERIPPGTPRSDIESRLGVPSSVHRLADGMRLQYSWLPAGQQVYNLDLDAQARLRRVDQVMDLAWFHRIGVDRWTRQDVLLLFGRPAWVERVARFDGDIWTYRFLEATRARQAHIHLDPSGVVRRVMFSDEPVPDDLPDLPE